MGWNERTRLYTSAPLSRHIRTADLRGESSVKRRHHFRKDATPCECGKGNARIE